MSEPNSEIIFEIEEDPEGGFVAHGIGVSIHAQADDLEGLKQAVRDAVVCHFEDGQAPRLIRLHLVQDFLVAV